MIESLDGLLGILDILEEDEVLAIGSLWVEVLSLTHLNGDNWSTFCEQLDQFVLSDFSWDVFHKQVGFESLSDSLLDVVCG